MTTPAVPTQMIILPIKATATIEDVSTPDGQLWTQILDTLEAWPGFQRLYWGRHVEEPDVTELHVVRDTLQQHYSLLSSPEWAHLSQKLSNLFTPESTSPSAITVRHAQMSDFTPYPQGLGKGAPVTGTAIYLAVEDPEDGWERVWALWTTLISRVRGCLGCSGGWVVEPVDGHPKCYTVWVGWESVEVHDAYHYTKDFWKKRVILGLHNLGWREYGHVAFTEGRSRRAGRL
ncbi:hypothetical protein P168DRAFT_327593 [Aspergillus campestris IBT 28561]|uniref:ABM domain-containing protein n=1 Tax=Aspergillus campestris (strain IBT 28561) TaxID=1392248 RepID=A0A2I1D0X5_ASPC2|nr:uncharacterized protein P168DRAFT_327593 [Aspergillus campestris IBT 28561]PKY03534.1 hypothetical protein P168DRAFT_327593 [Aspergillus campestris IBT 28561]